MAISAVGALRHVLDAQQFSPDLLDEIFTRADEFARDPAAASSLLAGRLMATLFYEPSTRTRLSFEAAMLRLGGGVISSENAREFSSAVKGETLEDTIRIVAGYADVIVLRHFEVGAAGRAAAVAPVPILNAGDGTGQHPTQALLDVYTIRKEVGRLDGLTVAMVGDLANGRTVHSLAQLLSLYRGNRLIFVSPPALSMRPDVKAQLDAVGTSWVETADLDDVLPQADVVYQTRIQKERFANANEYEALKGTYRIDSAALSLLREHAILMHPLPRVDEIDPAVDSDPRSAYFRQARNGVPVRMALLDMVLR